MNKDELAFGAVQVLERAIQMAAIGEVDALECPNGAGNFCPLCFIAEAKSELDNRNGTGVDPLFAMLDMMTGSFTEQPSDRPLADARDLIDAISGDKRAILDRKGCVDVLHKALMQLQGEQHE